MKRIAIREVDSRYSATRPVLHGLQGFHKCNKQIWLRRSLRSKDHYGGCDVRDEVGVDTVSYRFVYMRKKVYQVVER